MKRTALGIALLICVAQVGCDQSKQASRSTIENSTVEEPSPPSWSGEDEMQAIEAAMEADTVGDTHDVAVVQEDVRRIGDALYKGNVERVVDYTYPPIIRMLGGPEKLEAQLKEVVARTQELGMRIESFTFPEDPTFLTTDRHHFAIVPTLTIMNARGQRVESLNFQFGIRERGSEDWKYLEGSRVNSRLLNALFRDFPSDFKFPEWYRRKL